MTAAPSYLVDRELSWLKFNGRVLEEAARDDVPLCERLQFLRIFQTNLDEFFKVRVGTLVDHSGQDVATRLKAVRNDVNRLLGRKEEIYGELLSALGAMDNPGVTLVPSRVWTEAEKEASGTWAAQSVVPLLTAIAIGKRQTFPFLRDREIYLVAGLGRKGAKGNDAKKRRLGVVGCTTSGLDRLVTLVSGRTALLEDVIRAHAHLAFPGYDVHATALVRVTRNADLDPDSEYDDREDYREFMGKLMKARRHFAAVRLEVASDSDPDLVAALQEHLHVDDEATTRAGVPLDFAFFDAFRDRLRGNPMLFYPRHTPRRPLEFARGSVLSQVGKGDRLLAYPYDSMHPFITFLQEAASDPKTVSIRITLYRVAAESQVVEALVAAAENGKEVEAIVELKARFDEENNIELSRRLEAAGCQVVYGLEGYKVHSKLCLVTRLGANGPECITQIGTGNYNEKTSRLYTDFSFMTCDPEIAADAAKIFRSLSLGNLPDPTGTLLVAPLGLKPRILELIRVETEKAAGGKSGYIGLKLNGLTDRDIIDALVTASRAGVKVDLVIRGICRLVPGLSDATENVRVVSIVGRFLEHARLYIFGRGKGATVYISSADFMTRNTTRRVEVAAPIRSQNLRRLLLGMFETMLADNRQSWQMGSDGTYARTPHGEPSVSSQESFCANRRETVAS